MVKNIDGVVVHVTQKYVYVSWENKRPLAVRTFGDCRRNFTYVDRGPAPTFNCKFRKCGKKTVAVPLYRCLQYEYNSPT